MDVNRGRQREFKMQKKIQKARSCSYMYIETKHFTIIRSISCVQKTIDGLYESSRYIAQKVSTFYLEATAILCR